MRIRPKNRSSLGGGEALRIYQLLVQTGQRQLGEYIGAKTVKDMSGGKSWDPSECAVHRGMTRILQKMPATFKKERMQQLLRMAYNKKNPAPTALAPEAAPPSPPQGALRGGAAPGESRPDLAQSDRMGEMTYRTRLRLNMSHGQNSLYTA